MMVWNTIKLACRIYTGATAFVLLSYVLGQALTGGIRVEASTAHMMRPWDAFWLVTWLIATILTAIAAKSEA